MNDKESQEENKKKMQQDAFGWYKRCHKAEQALHAALRGDKKPGHEYFKEHEK